jgi:type IV pilus assembly protein PilB
MISHLGHEQELRFGEFLARRNVLEPEKVASALAEQERESGRLGEVLVRLGLMSDERVADALGEYLSIERISLKDLSVIDVQVARSIPESLAKRFGLIAVRHEAGDGVVVAMADPLDMVARDTIALRLGRSVKVAISTIKEINQAIESVYHASDIQEQRIRDLIDGVESDGGDAVQEVDESEVTDITGEAAANKAPVIRFVDLLLSQAVKSRASDIHIEPQEKSMAIRMRIDGLLREMAAPPRAMQAAVLTRVKILAGMDIAERRLPQDGRFTIKAPGRDIDLRVSAIPTIHGEKIVMRILDKAAVNHNLDELGFEPELLTLFKRTIEQPHGIIIVTGPTGSGKSTTLYSALNFLKDPRLNITTVENPVEYRLGGINQIQTKAEIGLTFASCLRTILRQDPDIILIGEIRDKETMEIAIQASLTGHLVLSTFHTNDAPSALSRLSYMGLERYLLASSLNLIIAQRLVRRICPHCKEPAVLTEAMRRRLRTELPGLNGGVLYQGKGCKQCEGTGYSGRLPLFEFLPMDLELRELVAAGFVEAQVRSMARAKGFGGLLESGMKRMLDGLTTPEEVLRVTFIEESYPSQEKSPAASEVKTV